jgi:hypothetical protein
MSKNKNKFLVLITLPLLLLYGQACKKYSPFIKRAKPEITITGNDSRLAERSIHLSRDTVYILSTWLARDSGQDLTIDAGTLIKVEDNIAIIIRQGATIQAKGTATEPIVFTSTAYPGTAGVGLSGNNTNTGHRWNGLWIYGSTGVTSGTLNYVRIEFAGGNQNDITAALYLHNVPKATSIEHVQVSYSFLNSSFEFAGGDCDARYLVSYASVGSDFYLHQGYTGRLQNILAYRHPYFPDNQSGYYPGDALAGMLIRDDTTLPSISNLTVLGPEPVQTSSKYAEAGHRVAAFVALGGAKFHIRNSIFLSFPKAGWYLDDAAVASSISNGQADLTWSIVHCNDSLAAFYLKPGTLGSATSADFKNFMLQSSLGNQLFLSADQFMLTDPFNYNVRPDPYPRTGSPLLSGANFDAPFNDAFFNKVDYRGALGSDKWMASWTNFLPLQTNYNN